MTWNTKGRTILHVTLLLFLFSFTNCRQADRQPAEGLSNYSSGTKYAKGFQINHFEGYTRVVINNPWSRDASKPYAVYHLYKNDSVNLPGDGLKLKIPLKSVVVNTFPYFEFLRMLNELDKVVGVTDVSRIYSPDILQRIQDKKTQDLGDPFNPNIEKTLILKPDATINSAYAQQDIHSERLQNMGIPVIFSLEWMENSPLARTEWIKFISVFFDRETLADSLFDEIEARYLAKAGIVENITNKPTVLAGDNFQDTWYVPGGKSFNAVLFADAGLDYFYKNNAESGSIGLDIESVLTQFSKADVWFGCDADSYDELAGKDKKYLLLEPVANRRVFNNRNRITRSGGNDYFESAIAHPDLVLSDLIKAAHPGLLSEESFTYIKPLE